MIVRALVVLFLMISSFAAGYIISYNSTTRSQVNSENNDIASAPTDEACYQEVAELKAKLNATSRQKPPALISNKDAENTSAPAVDRSQNSDRLTDTIDSIAELEKYLNSVSEDDFDLSLAINFINNSPDGFDFMVGQYQNVTDPSVKQFIRDIMSEVEHPEKVDFALELLNSKDPDDRSDAYNWLEQSEALSQPDIYRALVEASYFEEDPQALAGLISTISTTDDTDGEARDTAINRLKELTLHNDPQIASQAISSVSTLTQDDATLNMLKSHLYGGSEERKLAALNGLYYFNNADESLISSIEKIAADSSSSADIKEVARDLAQTLREVSQLQTLEESER